MLHFVPTVVFLISCVHPLQGAWELPVKKNTLVVDIDPKGGKTFDIVRLKCNASDDQIVTWRKKTSNRQYTGKTYDIKVKELVHAGNYTCNLNGNILDYKVILLNEQHQPVYKRILSNTNNPMHCYVKNYSGQFSCSWTKSDGNPEFIFAAQRGDYSIACQEPVKENSVYTVNCHDTQSCRYAEEENSIMVILHAIQGNKYESHTLNFVLREITKPDPPQDLKLSKTHNHKHLSIHWKYPKTWCNVLSFFPLIFNVKITKDNQALTEIHQNVEGTDLIVHHKEISGFCIQARDMYFNSSWSEWSCYKNEKKSKNKKENRKKKKKKKKEQKN